MVTPKNKRFFCFLFLFISSLLSDAKSAKQEIENLRKDIAVIESIIHHNNSRKGDILNDIQHVKLAITGSERIIRIILLEESVSDDELASLKSELDAIKKEVEIGKRLYQKILLEEYKHRDYRAKLVFLVSSKNINQFLNRIRQLERLKDFRVKHLKAIYRKQEELKNKIIVYAGSEEDRQNMVVRKQKARSELKFLIEEKNTLLREVQKENNMLQMRLNASQSKLDELQKTVQKEIGETEISSLDLRQDVSKLDWPVENGLIVGKFGIQNHTTIHKIKIENNGVDILVPENEPIECILPGTVKAVFEIPGYNSSIIVNHGNFISVYANVKNPLVREGSTVNNGTQLATIARNEENLFQLHFELWKGTQKVDPEKFLQER